MNAIAVTLEEGGDWIQFPCKQLNGPNGIRVHSIKYDNGAEWDAYNGWRHSNPWKEIRIRVKMGRSVA